jgi:hypothetical protein
MITNFAPLFRAMETLLWVTVPLAVWKLVDIAIWLFQHVHIK